MVDERAQQAGLGQPGAGGCVCRSTACSRVLDASGVTGRALYTLAASKLHGCGYPRFHVTCALHVTIVRPHVYASASTKKYLSNISECRQMPTWERHWIYKEYYANRFNIDMVM